MCFPYCFKDIFPEVSIKINFTTSIPLVVYTIKSQTSILDIAIPRNNNNTLSNQRGSTSGKRLQVHCLTVLLQTER